jgi:hypothetical protein
MIEKWREFLHRRAEIKAGVKNSANDAPVNETETSRFEWRCSEERRGKKASASSHTSLYTMAADDVAAAAAEGRLFVDRGGRACCIAAQRENERDRSPEQKCFGAHK